LGVGIIFKIKKSITVVNNILKWVEIESAE
jgi:hypothetical protein